MLRSLFLAAAVTLSAVPAAAAPADHDTPAAEALGARCESGSRPACLQLVELTGGDCAGPAGSGCRFDSSRFVVVDPEEPMVIVPGLEHHGWSRISTVQHCAELVEVADWSELVTDWELEGMSACLAEHT